MRIDVVELLTGEVIRSATLSPEAPFEITGHEAVLLIGRRD